MSGQKPVPLYSPKVTTANLARKPRIFVEQKLRKIADAIEAAGRSVTLGNLGYAVEVGLSGNWIPLKIEFSLPDAAEQEILFLSLESELLQGAQPRGDVSDGALALWQSCVMGRIDTKPPNAHRFQSKFDEILEHGGLFVLELAPRDQTLYQYAETLQQHPYKGEQVSYSSWDILSVLDDLDVESESGSEIHFDNGDVGQLLAQAATDASYECVFGDLPANWMPLAHNKRGKIVSAAYRRSSGGGLVLLLPTMPNLPDIIPRLFAEVFPAVCPSLFPDYKTQAWVHDERYESTRVLTLQAERQKLDAEYLVKVESSDAAIEAERTQHGHYYTLLRGTGDELVEAVISVLRELGFEKVIDVDALSESESNKVEDLQILDRECKLIVDVKGVAGQPSDSECQQAEKHARMRMRAWGITEVQPLTIINSQRLIPPHERDETAFREPIIKNAQDSESGLMTTWDLFRIVRGMREYGWPPSVAQDILYQIGRIDRIPSHYKLVGTITDIWQPAFAVELSDTIKQGDRFGVLTAEGYFESVAESIKLNDKPVEAGAVREKIGIALPEGNSKLRKGMALYRIDTSHSRR